MVISADIRLAIVMGVVCLIDWVVGHTELQKLIYWAMESKGKNGTSTSRASQGKITVLNGSLEMYEYEVKEILRVSFD